MPQIQDPAPAVASAESHPFKPTHGQTIALIAAIIVVFGAFIAVMTWFGNSEFWTATLFYIYWTSFEQRSYDRIPASLVGSLAGLGMAYMLVALPPVMGMTAGFGVTLAVIVIAVYFLIMAWLPLIINMATMLFLTVGGIPAVLHGASFPNAFIALIVGAVYLCLVTKGAEVMLSRRSRRAAV